MASSSDRNRRADARKSRAAILAAAVQVLDASPDAGLQTIARAAGVTRQTVYAHFAGRDQLLAAVVDRLTEQAAAAMDAVDLDAGPAHTALLRLLESGRAVTDRYPTLVRQLAAAPVTAPADRRRHAPIAERIERVVRRGQRTGEFDDTLPPDWLAAAVIALAHTASEHADAGHLSPAEADHAARTTILRTLGHPPTA